MESSTVKAIEFIKDIFANIEDRREVLRRILTVLIEQYNADRGSVWSVEGGLVVPIFSLNARGQEDSISQAILHLQIPLGKGFVGTVAETGQPNFHNDLQASSTFNPEIDNVTGHTTRNILSVPLNHSGKTIGVIQLLDRFDGRVFTAEDVTELMREYVPLAAIALDNANMYHEIRANMDFGMALLSSLDRTAVLRKLLAQLIQEFRVERGTVWSVSGNLIRPLFSLNEQGVEDEVNQNSGHLRIMLGQGFVGEVAEAGRPNYTNMPQTDSRFNPAVDIATGMVTRNLISIPLNRERYTIGVIQLVNRKDNGRFTDKDQDKLMQMYAPWATIALDNANIYEELSDLVHESMHNMGNLLGSARNDLYFLQQDLNDFVQSMDESLKSADKSLSQFIQWNKSHMKAYALNHTTLVNPETLIAAALERFSSKKHVTIHNQIPPNLPLVSVVVETATMHLFELLSNAGTAIEEAIALGDIGEGVIKIEGGIGSRHNVEMRFSNNGVQIPQEHHEAVFMKHVSLRKKDNGRNAGLGLWTARKYFERLGGSIILESSQDGWTTFLLKIPYSGMGEPQESEKS